MLLVNTQPIKAVPGRKTDVKDAEWIADLLSHGLLSARFIPSAPQRELRELTRYRTSLVEERAREVNRLQKTLEDTNLKLGDVVSDVSGKASRLILQAIVEGETEASRLASFAVGQVRADQQTVERALTGKVTAHHRFMLGQHLTLIENLDKAIRRVEEETGRQFTPPDPPSGEENQPPPEPAAAASTSSQPSSEPLSWQEAVQFIEQVTGISERVAQGLLAEIGVAVSLGQTSGVLGRHLPGQS